jgi:predicted nucleic acid-binding Zn ribbon protein
MIQTVGWRFSPDLDYLTPAEQTHFKRLREVEAISFFRIAFCTRCGSEIPKIKTYCSKQCKGESEQHGQDKGK